MKKILGIVVLVLVCGIAVFFATRKSDYAYVKDLLAPDGSDAFLVTRQDDKIVQYVVSFEKPAQRLIKIATKQADSNFGYGEVLWEFVPASSGYVFVSVLSDDVLQGEAAERGCNYKLLYLPTDKDNTHIFDEGNVNSVVVCRKN